MDFFYLAVKAFRAKGYVIPSLKPHRIPPPPVPIPMTCIFTFSQPYSKFTLISWHSSKVSNES